MKFKVFLFFVFIFSLTVEIFGEFQVNHLTSKNQTNSAVAFDSRDNYIIVWHSYLHDGNSGGIFARRYDSDGSAFGNQFQVNTLTVGNQQSGDISVGPDDRFVVVWQGPDPNGDGSEDIFGRIF